MLNNKQNMNQLSDEESSGSSNDFLISADKINLNSSFFKQSMKKSNLKKTPMVQESKDDFDECHYSNGNMNTAELLSQASNNLEMAKNQNFKNKTNQLVPSTSKMFNLTDYESSNLSKEINDLLQQGESPATLSKQYNDIEDKDYDLKADIKTNYILPQSGIQIHLPEENFMFNKRKKQQDLQKLLQNKFNQRIRNSQISIHKVGLLCWLSHGFFLNRLANDPELLGITLSIVSSKNYPKNQIDLKYIEKFTKWFTGIFKIDAKYNEVTYSKDLLIQRIIEKKIYNYKEIILLYVATLRGMGINCRLVISLQPPSLKPSSEQLFKFITSRENVNLKSMKPLKNNYKKNEKNKKPKNSIDLKISTTTKIACESEEQLVFPKKINFENNPETIKIDSLKTKKQTATTLKIKMSNLLLKEKTNSKESENVKNAETDNSNDPKFDDVANENLSIAKKLYLKSSKSKKQGMIKANISCNEKETKSKSKNHRSFLKRKSQNYKFSDIINKFSSDDDFIEKKNKIQVSNNIHENHTITSKLISKDNKCQKLLSSDEDGKNIIKNTYNIWAEVYVDSEESWISINILDQKIHCISDIYKKADNPILYIIAWNSAGSLKDVTRRYCPHWLTDTRKKRVDEKWWSETLSNWKERKTVMSKREDEQLLQRELEQPLPKTVTECKGHPLYVLTRHLLKFEALYPPDVVPLGHLKTGETIYSRHCVHTLYSRETWIKRARVVKPSELAYKIVKSMPKYDKFLGAKIKDQPLELFGKWQTTAYVPPEAKNGKVPRNEYGNVDMFKKCMLPKGTVHINLPALNRIARKLNIDCAPACVGFNFGCRGALPAFEGFIVCEEYEDILRKAWEEEQIEAQIRAKKKHEKKIYENWKKLIKGLFIRERLAIKYNFKRNADYIEDKSKKTISVSEKKTVKYGTNILVKTSKRAKQEPDNVIKKLNHDFK